MTEPPRDSDLYRSAGYRLLVIGTIPAIALLFFPVGLDMIEGGSGYGLGGRGAFLAGLLGLSKPGRPWTRYALIVTLLLLMFENLSVQYPIGAPAWVNVAVFFCGASVVALPPVRKFAAHAE